MAAFSQVPTRENMQNINNITLKKTIGEQTLYTHP